MEKCYIHNLFATDSTNDIIADPSKDKRSHLNHGLYSYSGSAFGSIISGLAISISTRLISEWEILYRASSKKKTKSRTRVLNYEFHNVGTVIDFNGDGIIIIRIVQHPNQAVNIHIHDDDVAVTTVVRKPLDRRIKLTIKLCPRSEDKVDD